MIDRNHIREHMPIVCSEGGQFGTVDHIDGEYVKVAKDDQGQHHWFPLNWVTKVDDQVHVDRPGNQAIKEWSANPPMANTQSSEVEAIPL